MRPLRRWPAGLIVGYHRFTPTIGVGVQRRIPRLCVGFKIVSNKKEIFCQIPAICVSMKRGIFCPT